MPITIDRAMLHYSSAPPKKLVFVEIPVPRIDHGDANPEVHSVRYRRAQGDDPYDSVSVSVDFPDPWLFDGRYFIPGTAEWVNNYLIFLTGTGSAKPEDIKNRINSLKFATTATEVVDFSPTGLTGRLGYSSLN